MAKILILHINEGTHAMLDLRHAFSAALEENNKLKEHSWTQVTYSSKPNGRKSEVPTQNFRTSTNNRFEGLLYETCEEYVPDVEKYGRARLSRFP